MCDTDWTGPIGWLRKRKGLLLRDTGTVQNGKHGRAAGLLIVGLWHPRDCVCSREVFEVVQWVLKNCQQVEAGERSFAPIKENQRQSRQGSDALRG